MARNTPTGSDGPSRRKFLVAAGAAGITGMAGCTSGPGGDGGGSGNGSGNGSGSGANDGGSTEALLAGGSSTVYPITSQGASVWNSNPKPSDKQYWGPSQYGIQTDKRMADYWTGLYGINSDADNTQPPYLVNVGLSHSGTGLEKVMEGQVDIADSSAPVKAEFPDASQSTLEKFEDHTVGVDSQPLVVSRAIKENGVEVLDLQTVKKIYKGEIENWSQVPSYDGPDKKIQVIGRSVGSGTDTAFRNNVFDDPNASIPGVDIRKGQNQQVQTLVSNSDNAIAYLALAFLTPEGPVPPVGLRVDGTVYEYGKNLDAKGYPLSRDLHCYTWNGTSKEEAAFLRMLIHDYGQKNFVEPNNYLTLSDQRQKTQMEKLPAPEN